MDDRLMDLLEEVRTTPGFVSWLEKHQPELFVELSAFSRSVRTHATGVAWRGGQARPQQLLPGTAGSFSDRTDWRTWLMMGGRGCVAAGTLIADPFGGPGTKVEDWAGGPVWARRRFRG